ncbi:Phosphotransferase enzyme family protein [Marinomonas aquimarina]|uniref:Phosphotransferase enzyme family protein n=1 Tax=Marinomonas aquimarina TaxID=295068 RepID=A0A1A8TRW1_9GAMM|nr:phosphotransferase [Marinomonas aquimarina]SBS36280.1 Phosphotransferase enzyme family protein [Marinomonas aquimarina]
MTTFAPEFFIKHTLRADYVAKQQTLQSLWSGYGHISRYHVTVGNSCSSVILKAIDWGQVAEHPRGWQSDLAHQRKVHSYQVELNWYAHWAQAAHSIARMPKYLGHYATGSTLYLLLEDLDASGFDLRCASLDAAQVSVVLHWLASLHAHYLTTDPAPAWPEGLWPQGTYWYLATRPNEWQAMKEGALKAAAEQLDQTIRNCPYQTLVHGDAKVANFCFSADLQEVAAVDFQYIGRGIGVQDVAYLLGSCLSEAQLAEHLDYLLDVYFSELARCIIARGESPDLAEAVAQQWYQLFPVAWADFHRFIMGWCPTHAKNNAFSRRMTQVGLDYLTS